MGRGALPPVSEKYKLPEKKFIKEYSRGMKMKLSLAAALATDPGC